jgi:alkaline phosphatase D
MKKLFILFLLLKTAVVAQDITPADELRRAVNAPVREYTRSPKAVSQQIPFEEKLRPFYHGVASGDPMSDRVIIWTRVTPESEQNIEVFWRIATDTLLKNTVRTGKFTTDQTRDYTVKIDVEGLQPNTTYYYGFTALGRNSLTGRTKTAPVTTDRLRFAVVSCANYQQGFFNAYGRIADRNDLDAVIHLGDYIYEYAEGGYGYSAQVGRGHEPEHETVTQSDYRIRYSFYKLDPDLRRIHQQHPFISVWDDHETANNSFKDGAQNHQPDTEGDWQTRKNSARQAYFEWMPVRENGAKMYRTMNYGNLAEIYMLDTRLEGRQKQLDSATDPSYNDPARTMLGAEQLQWLFDNLNNSSAHWKIIGNQTMFAQLRSPLGSFMDQWDGYPAERAKILDFLKNNSLKNVLVMTGDIHTSWANDLSSDPFTASAYNAATGSGSLGVEFITPSITAANFNEASGQPSTTAQGILKALNPHIKFIDLDNHGYFLLDLTQERAQADWYHVDTILTRSNNEHFAQAALVQNNANFLTLATTPAPPRDNAPHAAPGEPPTDIPSGVSERENLLKNVMVVGNYPNPADEQTSIHYLVSAPQLLGIRLYASDGRFLKTLFDGEQQPGVYALPVVTAELSSGAYLYSVETVEGKVVRKIVVQR